MHALVASDSMLTWGPPQPASTACTSRCEAGRSASKSSPPPCCTWFGGGKRSCSKLRGNSGYNRGMEPIRMHQLLPPRSMYKFLSDREWEDLANATAQQLAYMISNASARRAADTARDVAACTAEAVAAYSAEDSPPALRVELEEEEQPAWWTRAFVAQTQTASKAYQQRKLAEAAPPAKPLVSYTTFCGPDGAEPTSWSRAFVPPTQGASKAYLRQQLDEQLAAASEVRMVLKIRNQQQLAFKAQVSVEVHLSLLCCWIRIKLFSHMQCSGFGTS